MPHFLAKGGRGDKSPQQEVFHFRRSRYWVVHAGDKTVEAAFQVTTGEQPTPVKRGVQRGRNPSASGERTALRQIPPTLVSHASSATRPGTRTRTRLLHLSLAPEHQSLDPLDAREVVVDDRNHEAHEHGKADQ